MKTQVRSHTLIRLGARCLCLALMFLPAFFYGEDSTQEKRRALIGIAHTVVDLETDTVAQQPRWAYEITFILPDSAAFHGGLEVGDMLLSWDGITLDTISKKQRRAALREYIKTDKNIGDPLIVEILRFETEIHQAEGTISDYTQGKWMALLKHPRHVTEETITLKHRVSTFQKTLVLGKRFDDVVLPNNQQLLSEPLPPTPTKLLLGLQAAERLTQEFGLQEDYQDLLQRYEDDEKWDQGYRLNLFRYLHRAPHQLLAVVNHYSQRLFDQSGDQDLTALFSNIAELLSLEKLPVEQLKKPNSDQLEDHIQYIEKLLALSHQAHERAFQALNEDEKKVLPDLLTQLMNRLADSFYISESKQEESGTEIDQKNRKVLSLMKRIDWPQMLLAADYLRQLNDREWIKLLREKEGTWGTKKIKNKVFSGKAIAYRESTYGRIIIAGSGDDNYLNHVDIIIDIGGNDQYFGNNSVGNNALSMLIDAAGNDLYSSALTYSHGSAFLGVSLLFDYSGDDRYTGAYYSQGCAVGGIGILRDYSGDDRYWGQRFAQGCGFWGIGALIDEQGDDRYHAWRYSQGVGGILGVGLLSDLQGNDEYRATGESRSSYRTVGNFRSLSQGFGVGFRGYASGGIGLLLDGGGSDRYEAGNFAQGAGYFFGLGVLRDFSDQDDSYHASRYGLGASAHSAAGVFIEDGGNDRYSGQHVALLSAAWDLGLAAFWEKSGNDTYHHRPSTFSLGVASHNGYSLFLDSAGQDNYRLSQPLRHTINNDYHGGSSFAFFMDFGGETDTYETDPSLNNTLDYRFGHRFSLDSPLGFGYE